MDGEPITIVSGAMHYFRILREYWHDRLLKLKECGFNCVETYICRYLCEQGYKGAHITEVTREPDLNENNMF